MIADSMQEFQRTVWEFYGEWGRSMPWRVAEADGSFDAYKIMVSELMLQQTQVARVRPKFEEFLVAFPNVAALAAAPLSQVLKAWSGLGYNRRAQYLHRAATQIMQEYGGELPRTQAGLERLSGIGPNTAGAIIVYAYNQPAVFIETNIRTVYIHHFFANHAGLVADRDSVPIIQETLDHERPREWYWALMDYGTHLKATAGNTNKRSRHYTKQTTFQGSRRQIRGHIIKLLLERPYRQAELQTIIDDPRLHEVLQALLTEQLVLKHKNQYHIAN
jgi:A/G-specific adenine glycosylase